MASLAGCGSRTDGDPTETGTDTRREPTATATTTDPSATTTDPPTTGTTTTDPPATTTDPPATGTTTTDPPATGTTTTTDPRATTADAGAYFGRLLEPPGGRMLHGGGQAAPAFRTYWDLLAENPPLLFMVYAGPWSDGSIAHVGEILSEERFADRLVIPQIGLKTFPVQEEIYNETTEGMEFVDNFVTSAKELDYPAFVRIGYEFNGSWNQPKPDVFPKMWQIIVDEMEANGVEEVATVWCLSADGDDDYMPFYPGNEFVDWWGIDVWGPSHFTGDLTGRFLADARERQFPVLIGESSARRVDFTRGQESWDEWFEPYFDFLYRHDHVKATGYINWDWTKRLDGALSEWGDARLQQNDVILENYREAMADDAFIHAGPPSHVRSLLNLD